MNSCEQQRLRSLELSVFHNLLVRGSKPCGGTKKITEFQVAAASDEFERPWARVCRSQTACGPQRHTQSHSRPDAEALRSAAGCAVAVLPDRSNRCPGEHPVEGLRLE